MDARHYITVVSEKGEIENLVRMGFIPPPHPRKARKTERKRKKERKREREGFPGGAVVENLPANAGHGGSSPGLGGSHVPQSDWAREPQLLSLRVWSLCSATGEAAIVRGPRTVMRGGPPLAATRESPSAETRTQHSHE